MHILFISGESYPFSPLRREGRRVEALAGAILQEDKGAEVSVVLPLYFSLPEGKRRRMRLCRKLFFLYGWRHTEVTVYRLREDGVSYYFLENDRYFGRERTAGYFDDGERFAFFGYAVKYAIGRCIPTPELLVASGYRAAPALITLSSEESLRRTGIRTAFLPEDIRRQGCFEKETLSSVFAWGKEAERCILDGKVNLLRGGMLAAERVYFPSRNELDALACIHTAYGLRETQREIRQKAFLLPDGFGREHSPGEGEHPYTPARVTEGKRQNKRLFLEKISLRQGERLFLLACLSLEEEEEISLLERCLPGMLEGEGRLYFCGVASAEGMGALLRWEKRFPGRMLCRFTEDPSAQNELLAAADLLLCPAEREGEGTVQRGLRFGTPVLASRLSAGDLLTEENGFLFTGAVEFMEKFRMAEALFPHRGAWGQRCRSAIRAELSDWRASANRLLAFAGRG